MSQSFNAPHDPTRPVSALAHLLEDRPPEPRQPTARMHAELDELGQEVARLQDALLFWLPRVPISSESEIARRIANDAYLLAGVDGNVPDDHKCAEELGWITLNVGQPTSDSGELPVLPDESIEALIDDADCSLHDGGQYRIDGAVLMNLCRAVALAAIALKETK